MSRMTEADEDLLRAAIGFLAPNATDLVLLQIAGNPQVKKRHRQNTVTKVWYDPPENQATQQRLRAILRHSFRQPWTGTLAMVAIFHMKTRRRVDGDNLLKMLQDAGNGVAWADDSQLVKTLPQVEYDPLRPRTLIAVAPTSSTMGRGKDVTLWCEACLQSFPSPEGSRRPKRCGDCALQRRGAISGDRRTCAGCGTPFRPKHERQFYCRVDCRNRGPLSLRVTPL